MKLELSVPQLRPASGAIEPAVDGSEMTPEAWAKTCDVRVQCAPQRLAGWGQHPASSQEPVIAAWWLLAG
jgi:hypothetical protein